MIKMHELLKSRLPNLAELTPTWAYGILFPILLFLHNPHAILHAELWGEDGPVWYGQAYQAGLRSLLLPNGGYLNSIQRMAGIIALSFPLEWLPTVFAIIALVIQASPALFLVSNRLKSEWPNKASRVLFAVLIVLMPNAAEIQLNVTNSQWHLALLAFFVLASSPPSGTNIKIYITNALDFLVLFISGLSGPFGIILVPMATVRFLRCADNERMIRILRGIIIFTTAFIQLLLIAGFGNKGRATGPLGATPGLLAQIFAMIPLGALFGAKGIHKLETSPLWQLHPIWILVAVPAFLFVSKAFDYGSRLFKEFFCFSLIMFVLALFKPLISSTIPQWPLMLHPFQGNRYFFYPMLSWWGAMFILASSGVRWQKNLAYLLLLITFSIAVPLDWGDAMALPETDFLARAKQFDGLPKGLSMTLPLHPPGEMMRLVKVSAAEPSASVEFSELEHALALRSSESLCAIDFANQERVENLLNVKRFNSVSFSGWVLRNDKSAPDNAIFLLHGKRDYGFRVNLGLTRGDLVKAMGNSKALKSGYSVSIPFSVIEPGHYQAELLAGSGSCDARLAIEVAG